MHHFVENSIMGQSPQAFIQLNKNTIETNESKRTGFNIFYTHQMSLPMENGKFILDHKN